MSEFVLMILAAVLIYSAATRLAPHGLIFKLEREESKPQTEKKNEEVVTAPGNPSGLLAEGQELFNKGAYNFAEKKFLNLLKEEPNSKEAYHFLGMIYIRQDLYKGAVATLEKACELDPLNDTDFNNLGLAYYNLGDYPKAIQNLEKSISLNDKIAHRHLNLAMAYQKIKDFDRAAIALENAARIHPNKENMTMLAKNYLEMKEKKLALKTLEQLAEIDPEDSWTKRQIAALKN